MALGSPSGQCHMAYNGTPVPLIFPRTMAQYSHHLQALEPTTSVETIVILVIYLLHEVHAALTVIIMALKHIY